MDASAPRSLEGEGEGGMGTPIQLLPEGNEVGSKRNDGGKILEALLKDPPGDVVD